MDFVLARRICQEPLSDCLKGYISIKFISMMWYGRNVEREGGDLVPFIGAMRFHDQSTAACNDAMTETDKLSNVFKWSG